MFDKFKTLFAALILAVPLAVAGPVHAQARGVAVVNVDAAVQGTNAYRTALTQVQSTYASQIQAVEARQQALDAELAPLRQALQAAQNAPNATPASVQQSAQALATRQQTAQAELNQMQEPYLRAIAYAREQVMLQLEPALLAAMAAANVDLVLRPEAVLTATPNSPANLTSAVTAQLNSRVASVQIAPPADWQPGDTVRAAQQQQQPAQQTEGR